MTTYCDIKHKNIYDCIVQTINLNAIVDIKIYYLLNMKILRLNLLTI